MDNSFIILKYKGFRASCAKFHKGEQNDRTKTLAEFPDPILNDYGLTWNLLNNLGASLI